MNFYHYAKSVGGLKDKKIWVALIFSIALGSFLVFGLAGQASAAIPDIFV